ncbi:hypothetical protein CEXT_759691 [Caerostris extrusa]|uniref:Uncharacterized protein n=1 Tax=Caerostris extrusa TaxID=172846 RepID=A0AAV4MYV7_CAEEX|nr:hypothetical protein CEXT_759691 [Caerostris extrusa]
MTTRDNFSGKPKISPNTNQQRKVLHAPVFGMRPAKVLKGQAKVVSDSRGLIRNSLRFLILCSDCLYHNIKIGNLNSNLCNLLSYDRPFFFTTIHAQYALDIVTISKVYSSSSVSYCRWNLPRASEINAAEVEQKYQANKH